MGYREEYEKWLSMFKDDEATVKELESIRGNEKEIEDRFCICVAQQLFNKIHRFRIGEHIFLAKNLSQHI